MLSCPEDEVEGMTSEVMGWRRARAHGPSMRELVVAACLIIAGLIHVPPLLGLLSSRALDRLYGVAPPDPTHRLLMRHRAVLFGIVAALLIAAAFDAALRTVAIAAGSVSALSFLALASITPGTTAPIARVVRADWIAALCLVLAALLSHAG